MDATEKDDTFDVIVVGAGPVGENAAQYATEGTSLTAAVVESELVGGECSYYACIPSKALLRPVEIVETTRHLPGVRCTELDRDALLARRDSWVSSYDDSVQADWVEGAGYALVRGRGRLAGEHTVVVDTADGERILRARVAVIVATGSSPIIPALFRDVDPWTSRDATGVQEVPDSIAIIGGGVVACEAATWLAALGSRVTLLVRGDSLLSGLEPFAREAVRASLEAHGVDVRLETSVESARRDDPAATGLGRIHGGPVHLELADGKGTVDADEVLVATGRRPALEDLGLESIGLDPRTALDTERPSWLYLVGDASGEAPLTHWGKYRSRVIGAQIAADADPSAHRPADPPADVPVPQVVFTDPQVAQSGLTEQAARDRGLDVVAAHVPWSSAAGSALLRDDTDGCGATIVVRRDTGALVGATFAGPEAGELIHAATVAIVSGAPVSLLRHAVPSFPTAAELWLRLLEELPRDLR